MGQGESNCGGARVIRGGFPRADHPGIGPAAAPVGGGAGRRRLGGGGCRGGAGRGAGDGAVRACRGDGGDDGAGIAGGLVAPSPQGAGGARGDRFRCPRCRAQPSGRRRRRVSCTPMPRPVPGSTSIGRRDGRRALARRFCQPGGGAFPVAVAGAGRWRRARGHRAATGGTCASRCTGWGAMPSCGGWRTLPSVRPRGNAALPGACR